LYGIAIHIFILIIYTHILYLHTYVYKKYYNHFTYMQIKPNKYLVHFSNCYMVAEISSRVTILVRQSRASSDILTAIESKLIARTQTIRYSLANIIDLLWDRNVLTCSLSHRNVWSWHAAQPAILRLITGNFSRPLHNYRTLRTTHVYAA